MQKPLLIDLDGVLRIGKQPAEDIIPFLRFLEEYSIPTCILSNSSMYSSKQIYNFFASHSIEIKFPIITAIEATYLYIKGKYNRVAAYTSENVIDIFTEFLDFENPQAVLIGDIGDVWNYNLMQLIFEYVQNGAELIAVHKNKFWEKPKIGIQLDAGPFIHAIEFATSSKATLIGKPSSLYFKSALQKINSGVDEPFIMLGDDLDTDISGSKKLGAETILIYSGKTKHPYPLNYFNQIDHEANNLSDVITILSKNKIDGIIHKLSKNTR